MEEEDHVAVFDDVLLAFGPEFAGVARALLADADRLAAAGDYDGATHLLLRRSVEQIEEARAMVLPRALTAREIAAYAHLPAKAQTAFSLITARVEASRYALRPLNVVDWQAARAAYTGFAGANLAAVAPGTAEGPPA